jgi:hypothetical protein
MLDNLYGVTLNRFPITELESNKNRKSELFTNKTWWPGLFFNLALWEYVAQ